MSNQQPQPTLTTVELYKQLEAEAFSKGPRGEKGEKIRYEIENFAKEVGQKKLLISALFTILVQRMKDDPPVRAHVKNVCECNWKTGKDETGLVWVDLALPKPSKKS